MAVQARERYDPAAAGPLDGVRLERVDSCGKLDDFRRWAGERRDGPLCFDTESGGLSPYRDRLRLVQVGDEHAGWAFPSGWWGAAVEVLQSYPWLAAANLSYDNRVLARHAGFRPRWECSDDVILAGRLADSLKPAALKDRAALDVDPRAADMQAVLEDGMARNKWTYDTVPDDWEPYWRYGAMDTVLTAHLHREFAPAMARYRACYDLERAVARVCAGMMDAGMLADVPFIEAKISATRDEQARIMPWLESEHGITSVRSAAQLAGAMRALGVELTELTDGGAPSFTKGALGIYAARHPQAAWLCTAIRRARKAEDICGKYLGKFLELRGPDDIVHYSINTMRADTHRQCLPVSHHLLTRRGILHVSEVRLGDLTPDMDGKWTPVRAVHQYQGESTVVWENRNTRLESTPEHRWVQTTESTPGVRLVEELPDANRRVLLSPQDRDFDFTARQVPLDGSDSAQFAAVIGWLVSDGHCADRGRDGLDSCIWQTEKKFYREALRCVPSEALSSDKERDPGYHKIGIRAGWLRPRLEAAGLSADPLLRTSETILPWVLSLGLPDLRAFLGAVWLANGSTAVPRNRMIAMGHDCPALAQAIQYAGYRLGWKSRTGNRDPSAWGANGQGAVGVYFSRPVVVTGKMHKSVSTSDVWCVSTDSGTFTAWDFDFGPYLTGNSITDPPMQTFDRDEPAIRGSFIPRPGNVFITIDADQIEARLAAIFSRDQRMLADFRRCDAEGLSFFVEMASKIYGEQVSKKDPRYSWTKNGTYAQIYGSGLATAARTFGVPEEQLKPSYDGFRKLYPGVQRLMRRTIDQARARPRPGVETLMGRTLYCRRGYEYVLQDYRIQGSAAEIFKMGMVRLDAAGYGPMLRLPMHDEFILECPADSAGAVLHGITEVLTDRTSFPIPVTWGGSILPERWEKR